MYAVLQSKELLLSFRQDERLRGLQIANHHFTVDGPDTGSRRAHDRNVTGSVVARGDFKRRHIDAERRARRETHYAGVHRDLDTARVAINADIRFFAQFDLAAGSDQNLRIALRVGANVVAGEQ